MTILENSISISILILAAAGIAAVVRLFRGPNLADRVIVFDHVSALAIGLFAIVSLHPGRAYLIDSSLMISLLSFLSTVGFAAYLERKNQRGDKS